MPFLTIQTMLVWSLPLLSTTCHLPQSRVHMPALRASLVLTPKVTTEWVSPSCMQWWIGCRGYTRTWRLDNKSSHQFQWPVLDPTELTTLGKMKAQSQTEKWREFIVYSAWTFIPIGNSHMCNGSHVQMYLKSIRECLSCRNLSSPK